MNRKYPTEEEFTGMPPTLGCSPEYLVQAKFSLGGAPKTSTVLPVTLYVSGHDKDGFYSLNDDIEHAKVFKDSEAAVECANEFFHDLDGGFEMQILLKYEKH